MVQANTVAQAKVSIQRAAHACASFSCTACIKFPTAMGNTITTSAHPACLWSLQILNNCQSTNAANSRMGAKRKYFVRQSEYQWLLQLTRKPG